MHGCFPSQSQRHQHNRNRFLKIDLALLPFAMRCRPMQRSPAFLLSQWSVQLMGTQVTPHSLIVGMGTGCALGPSIRHLTSSTFMLSLSARTPRFGIAASSQWKHPPTRMDVQARCRIEPKMRHMKRKACETHHSQRMHRVWASSRPPLCATPRTLILVWRSSQTHV